MKRIEKLEAISTYISIAQADITSSWLRSIHKLELEAEHLNRHCCPDPFVCSLLTPEDIYPDYDFLDPEKPDQDV